MVSRPLLPGAHELHKQVPQSARMHIHTSAALVLAHFNCAMLRIFLDCDLRDLPSKGTNRIEVGISPERYHNVEPARPASLEVNGQPYLLQNFPQSLGSCLHLAKVFA